MRARRLTKVMVVAQLAMTLMLLGGTMLLVRTFLTMYRVNVGADTSGILSANLRLADRKYPDPAAQRVFYDRLEARLAGVPGVVASIASAAPLEQGSLRTLIMRDGQDLAPGVRPEVLVVQIGSRYFDTLRVRLRHGRAFTERDGEPGREVAIVSELFVARFVARGNPIGWRLQFTSDRGQTPGDSRPVTIVGIAPAIRQSPPFWPVAHAVVYVPYRQEPQRSAIILARGRGPNPALLAPLLRDEVRQVDGNQPLYEVRPLDERLGEWSVPFRLFGTVFGVLSVMALVMASAGMYGIVAWTVSRRLREIGVRMALGASAAQVTWLFARQALGQIALGLAIGLAGAIGVGFVLRAIVVTSPVDPINLVSITALLVGVALVAVLVPSRRAARLDPMGALRSE